MDKLTRILHNDIYGDDVQTAQHLLNSHGIKCKADKAFGPNTRSCVIHFQKKKGFIANGIIDQKVWSALHGAPYALTKMVNIVDFPLPTDEYYPSPQIKTRIVLHHTASSYNPENVVHVWNRDRQTGSSGAVATAFVIGGKDSNSGNGAVDGLILRTMPEQAWAFSLGVSVPHYRQIEQQTIAIEVCNWGWLTKKGNNFYSWAGTLVPKEEVCTLQAGFRGQRYYQRYTDKQIESLRQLLIALTTIYNIPRYGIYNNKWFDYDEKYLAQRWSGIGNHTHYRLDKTDMFPQPELIEMLTNLNDI